MIGERHPLVVQVSPSQNTSRKLTQARGQNPRFNNELRNTREKENERTTTTADEVRVQQNR
jgi:hypothetical protein